MDSANRRFANKTRPVLAALGYDEHDPNVSPDWRRLVHPDDMARVQAMIRDHIAGKIPMFESVHRMRHTSGEWRWVVSRAKARVDPTGLLGARGLFFASVFATSAVMSTAAIGSPAPSALLSTVMSPRSCTCKMKMAVGTGGALRLSVSKQHHLIPISRHMCSSVWCVLIALESVWMITLSSAPAILRS